jgi:hypothetical protein
MTERELVQKSLEAIARYHQTVSPKECFADMVRAGIINEKGEVLITREEREAGHPIDDDSANGVQPG